MSDGNATAQQPHRDGGDANIDEKYLVRNPRHIRQLLQSLIDQRSLINAHPGGGDRTFPTAVLELDPDEDFLLLDGSPLQAINQSAEQASHVLCFAQLERVLVRFRLERLQRVVAGNRTSFRAAFPEEFCHLQRRELYRLETPIADSPSCVLPARDGGEAVELRVVDISGGGLALLLPEGQTLLSLQQRYAGCQLKLPEGPALPVTLIVCNMREQLMANGVHMQRIGLRFDALPRGGDAAIQRYIFRIDRQRNARKNGES
ncbi:flagellar brake protein [Stenotrophomonas sp. YIM B06876]|uniref:flagellar brake protein n=1 Tax=Stenotrophomonas sp. YIM B06876 TaxID=3060211 RepID=UPI00273A0931|nr:flagellar brake protein [Stenotrophomonas sp. YIM B06876]